MILFLQQSYVSIWILQTSLLFSIVSSTYDPNVQHLVENFDPSEADPKANISCVGDSYDLRLPLLDGFDPNGLSMHKICAKPQYGGGARWQHAGAFCDYKHLGLTYRPDGLRGDVAFDGFLDGAETSVELRNPRVLQACLYRCFCNFGVEDVSVQPRVDQVSIESSRAHWGYQLQIDVHDDFTNPNKRGPEGRGSVNALIQYQIRQFDGILGSFNEMNLDPGNEIECSGNSPTFAIPLGYSRDRFDTNQKLCAVALSGGDKDFNAGGYCHRSTGGSSTSPEVERALWFSDSMTPRLDWTWAGNNLLLSINLRFHCWRHCRCKGDPPRDPDSVGPWHFLTSLQLALQSDGSVDLQRIWGQRQQHQQQGQSQGQGTRVGGFTHQQVLPPQTPGVNDSASGTCGPGHNEFCPKQWDAAAWGPIPREPPNATDIVTSSPPQAGVMGVCGNKCSGPQDCSSTNSSYSCSCAFPSDSDAKMLGLDPVAPVTVCIALLAAAVGGGSGKGWLGGRDMGD